jgi:ribosomal protein L12E/L44/L45/RPP1/RPP2
MRFVIATSAEYSDPKRYFEKLLLETFVNKAMSKAMLRQCLSTDYFKQTLVGEGKAGEEEKEEEEEEEEEEKENEKDEEKKNWKGVLNNATF